MVSPVGNYEESLGNLPDGDEESGNLLPGDDEESYDGVGFPEAPLYFLSGENDEAQKLMKRTFLGTILSTLSS